MLFRGRYDLWYESRFSVFILCQYLTLIILSATAKNAESAAAPSNPSNSPSKRTTLNDTAAFEQNLANEAKYVHEVICDLAVVMILLFTIVHFL